MPTASNEARCSQRTMRVLDFAALVLIALGAALLGITQNPDHHGARRWADLGFAIAGGAVMIAALAQSLRRGKLDGDEYARRLVTQATAIGFFAAMTAYVVWRPLATSWVAAPTGDQMMALLFAGTGLGYFIARARGSW